MVKPATPIIGPLHHFTTEDVATLRRSLLAWYDTNQRVLPWRTIATTEPDQHKRAYAGEAVLQRIILIYLTLSVSISIYTRK